jgi:phage-related protein
VDQGGIKEFSKVSGGSANHLPGALTIAAEGGKADIAKPISRMGSGVFEVALPFKGNAFRVVYAVQIADEIWVVHAFQKKSTHGVKTPQRELNLIQDRLKGLKEMFR